MAQAMTGIAIILLGIGMILFGVASIMNAMTVSRLRRRVDGLSRISQAQAADIECLQAEIDGEPRA